MQSLRALATMTPETFVSFWREAGPMCWFGKLPEFDGELRERFLPLHEAAARGELDGWANSPTGALALVLLLDQFPRNAFRGTPRMYATDALARAHADRAVRAEFEGELASELQLFFFLPFAHSEELADQDRSVRLHERIGYTQNARRHRDIIRRFGRFPHRNQILGRVTTREERAFLEGGGFAG